MKITVPVHKHATFKDIVEGEVFESEGSYYMKIDNDVSNAVDLSNGVLDYFKSNDTVFPVDCELVIK